MGEGIVNMAGRCAKPPHFAHGTSPAAATLLRGGNYFSGRGRKNQFPRFALPSSPDASPPPSACLLLRRRLPPGFSVAAAGLQAGGNFGFGGKVEVSGDKVFSVAAAGLQAGEDFGFGGKVEVSGDKVF